MGLKKKLFAAVCCLLLVTALNFLLPRLMPGDPVLMLTGMDEAALSQQQYLMYQSALGLDLPLGQQLIRYLGELATGNLGYSYHLNAPVSGLIAGRLPATLQLAVPALVLSSLLAVLLGCHCGYSPGSTGDRCVSTTMIVLDALPGFLLAMLAVWLFGFRLDWLPLGGLSSLRVPEGGAFSDRLVHLVLPVTVVTLGSLPGKYMLVRGAVTAELREQYPAYAVARGLSGFRVRYLHLFRNACQPFVAMLGVSIGFILSGSMVVETIFSIKGMGGLLYQSIQTRDLPTMQGCLLVTAVTVVAATILADLALLALDPKARSRRYEE